MYRVLFKGKDTQTICVAGWSIPANVPQYVEELPLSLKKFTALTPKSVEVTSVKDGPSTVEEKEKERAVLTGKIGIKWVGTVAIKRTEEGFVFKKNETRWDIPEDVVAKLVTKPGFSKVSGK